MDTNKPTVEEINEVFEKFWLAGMIKVKKKKAKQLFIKIVKDRVNVWRFTDDLIDDIQRRLKAKQLGFDAMHPTTYLNQERWTDELREDANESRQSTESHAERTHRQASQARQQLGITGSGVRRDNIRPLRGIG